MDEITKQDVPVPQTAKESPVAQPCCSKCWRLGALVVGLLLAGSLFYAGYQFSKKQTLPMATLPTPTPVSSPLVYASPSPLPDETANWKTYTDSPYGFQIKVPPMWFLYPTSGSKDGKIYPGDTFQAYNYDRDDKNNYDAKLNLLDAVKNPLKVEVTIGSDNKKTLEEIKQEFLIQIGTVGYNPEMVIKEVTSFILDSKKAIKVLYNSPKIYLIVALNDKNYRFNISLYSRDVIELNKQLFDQILSTFKFLE